MVSTRSMMVRTKVRRSAIAVALPHDVVVHIVGPMAVSSPQPMADLCSLRATCKAMHKASNERAVGRLMALEREEAMKLLDNEHYLAVVNYLDGIGNPEACFIVSLTLIFVHQYMQRGLVCLDRAAVVSHKDTTYVFGLLLYTTGEAHDVGKHYICQVEGKLADGGRKMAKRTNRECKRYQRLTADAVREVTWKKIAGAQGRVLALPEDGHQCTNNDYGVVEGWGDYIVFGSDSCRIRHEYAKFFAHVLNYLS